MFFCRDSSNTGRLRLNFRGRDEETSDDRDRDRLRLVDASVLSSRPGRDSAFEIAAVVL